MKRHCLDCGEPFIGRSDKKFCTDMCRNSYHNKHNGYRNSLIRFVNHRLRKNRQILSHLQEQDLAEISRETLTMIGFDWQYFTEESVGKDKILRRYCYDFGIEMRNSESCRLISKTYHGRMLNPEYLQAVAEPSGFLEEMDLNKIKDV